MKNYPKKIEHIMREAPMGYGIIMLHDCKNKKCSVDELHKRWIRDKKVLAKQANDEQSL